MLNVVISILFLCCLTGCAAKQTENTLQQEEQQEKVEVTEDMQLYILLYTNKETKTVFLESVETGKQEEFSYNGGTYVYNRYESNTTMEQLEAGTAVRVTYTDENLLMEMKESTEIFVYDDITNYKIDTDKKIITVANSNYYYDEALKVFSGSSLISVGDLSKEDSICIRGLDKEVLTISVSKGHGSIRLKNTEIFEGGMITIGNVVAREITSDMVVEVPEGVYTLAVANDGYGGSREITVNRFEELVIDLDILKGEGPGYCMMKITVIPEDAKVTLNGNETDCSQPMELRYGSYRLSAKAEGYMDWSGMLVVSSKEANITIELEEDLNGETEENASEEDSDEKQEENASEEDSDEKTEENASEEDSDKKEEAESDSDKKEETKKPGVITEQDGKEPEETD